MSERLIVDDLPAIIELGRQGEHRKTIIEIDVSAWVAAHPGILFSISYTRPGEVEKRAAIETSRTGDVLAWRVRAAALDVPGTGTMVVRGAYEDAGEVRTRSAMTSTRIEEGHGGDGGPAPDPVDDWLQDAQDALDAIKNIRFSATDDGELEVNI